MAIAVALPLVLMAGCISAEHYADEAKQSEGYTIVEGVVRKFVDVSVAEVDGRYYDSQSVGTLRAEMRSRSEAIVAQAGDVLKPLVDESFTKRKNNIDSYLDWYFGLSSKRSELAKQVDTAPDEYVVRQFIYFIENDIDDTDLVKQYGSFAAEAEELKRDAERRLAACEVKGVPDWVIAETVTLEPDFLDTDLAPSNAVYSAYSDLVSGVPSGSEGEAIALRLSEAAARQEFSETLVSDIAHAIDVQDPNPLEQTQDAFNPLWDSIVNRERYKAQIEACINNEQGMLVEPLQQSGDWE